MENPPDLKDPSEQNRQLITKYQLSNLVLLGWFGALYYLGAYLFHQGFLLTRNELSKVNNIVPKWEFSQPNYDQVVLLAVDSLRYDFVKEQPDSSTYYHNQLPFVQEMLQNYPNSSYISKFVADTPATTLQRLKALTTGVLPSFMDMSNSLHGSELLEDNWVNQLKTHGKSNKKIGFVGDDTWTSLFPNDQFDKSYPFPSFDIRDLDTVDDGVEEFLVPMIKSNKFKVTIGHMLGVDHCSHRYGIDHPKMEEKLTQLDTFLRRIYDSINDNTLVLVFGDHGDEMLSESTAGLFAFSKATLPNPSSSQVDEVEQIDLVPTLSYLLDIPVPFNNLGSFIPSLVTSNSKNYANVNAQIYEYFNQYSQEYDNSEFVISILSDLKAQYDNLNASKPQSQKITDQIQFIRQASKSGRKIWTQFNKSKMVIGLILLASTVVINIFQSYFRSDPVKDPEPSTGILTNPYSAQVGYQVGAIFIYSILFGVVTGFIGFRYLNLGSWRITEFAACGAAIGSMAGYVIQHLARPIVDTIPSTSSGKTIWIPLFVVSLSVYFVAFPASNSFIITEDSNTLNLLQTFSILAIGHGFWYHSSENQTDKNIKKQLLYFGLGFLAINRLLGYITVCREEQLPKCIPTFYQEGLNAHKWILFLQAIVSLGLPQLIKHMLKRTQNYFGAIVIWTQILMPIALFLTTVHQYLENYDDDLIQLTWFLSAKVWCTRIAGLISVFSLFSWFYCPTLLDAQMIETGTGTIDDPKQRSMILLGFGNAYGAPILHFISIAFTILNLFQKSMGSLALTGTIIQLGILAEMFDALKDSLILLQAQVVKKVRPGGLPSRSLDLLHLMLQILVLYMGYFTTGHQMTLSSIQWNVGTIGLFEFNELISPMLIILNTLAPFLLSGFAIFLIPLWKTPMLRSRLFFTLPSHLSRTMVNLTFVAGLHLLGCAFWAMFHSHHIMVWKIFAPRFVAAELVMCAVWVSLMAWGHFVVTPRIITDVADILLHVKEANPLPYYFY